MKFCFSGVSEGVGKDAGILSSSHQFFPLLDTVVTRPGLQLHGLVAGTILKQETVTVFNLYVTVPNGLMGQDMSSLRLIWQNWGNNKCSYIVL